MHIRYDAGMRNAAVLLMAGVFLVGCAAGPKVGPPDRLQVADMDVESARIEFPAAAKGDGHIIQRKDNDGEWKALREVGDDVTGFTDEKLSAGNRYAYRLVRTAVVEESEVIRGGQEARLFEVDLKGVNRITLIATDGGDGNGNDHAIWGSPTLVKKDGSRLPLTELKPKSFWVGYGKTGKPRTIQIGSSKYENSIWAHAWSEMTYGLKGEYERFEAMVGVDIGQKERGSVAFRARVATSEFSDEVSLRTPVLVDSPGHTAYYVDSRSGDDEAGGTSMETPWKSLKRVNMVRFAPGDRILFKAGSRYSGQLRPHGSGKKGEPIVVDRYDGDRLPRIDGEGKYKETVLLSNVEHWHLNNLEVTNTGEERAPGRTGVRVTGYDCGVMHDIRLTGLFIHDVNGSLVKSKGGGAGIGWWNGGDKVPSYFDGLSIENCRLVRCDRNGISGGGYWDRGNWHPSRRVVIRGNLLEDIGGDGIVPIGCDGALIEHNVLRGGRTRCRDYAAGIWPWACDNTLVQFNEVSGMKGTKDGQGFDSDYNSRNSIFQYNYSHDNDGGFMLVCDANETGYSVGNIGTIIRYNISQNDGARTFQFGGPTKSTLVHNNVFYVKEGMEVLGIYHNNWNGWSDDVKFYNNIFYADGKMKHQYGKSTNNFYSHNVFYGNHENLPPDANIYRDDPMLASPGSGKDGLDSLKGYRLKPDSPCRGAGVRLPQLPFRDFWGNKIPEGNAPLNIGADQGD